jgi:ActR/RegA family two-component response regulator
MTLDRAVWEYIARTVETAGTLSGGARRLGIDRRSLKRMLKKYPPRR